MNHVTHAVAALVPFGVVTVTTWSLLVWGGAIAVICVLLLTVKFVASRFPNFTAVAPVNPVPVITTEVPPAMGPKFGVSFVTVGGYDTAEDPRLVAMQDRLENYFRNPAFARLDVFPRPMPMQVPK